MLHIARLTIWEALRRKILLATGVLTMGFLALFWLEVAHQPRMAVTQNPLGNLSAALGSLALGAFFCYFVIAFFSIFSVSGAVSAEIESGLLAPVIPRPLCRAEIVLGKWIGFAIVQLCFVSVLFFGIVAVVHAYYARVLPAAPAVVQAWALFVLQAWVLGAVTLLGSVRLSTLANGITIALSFTMAFLAGALAQFRFVAHGSVVNGLATAMSLVLPTDNLYRRAVYELAGGRQSLLGTALIGPFGVIKVPSLLYVLYAVVYLAVALTVSVRLFEYRDA